LRGVQAERDERRPPGAERADYGGGGDDSGDQADRVQRVDHVRQLDEGGARLGHHAVWRAFWNARSKPGRARTTVSRSTVSEIRMCPGMPKPEPGTVSTPSDRKSTRLNSSHQI